jgi:hypothetical protein
LGIFIYLDIESCCRSHITELQNKFISVVSPFLEFCDSTFITEFLHPKLALHIFIYKITQYFKINNSVSTIIYTSKCTRHNLRCF